MGLRELKRRLLHTCIVCKGLQGTIWVKLVTIWIISSQTLYFEIYYFIT